MSFSQEFRHTIPSDTVRGQEVQDRIVGLLEELEFSPRDVFGVRLALEEALVNAIKHGNGMDPDKNVHIICRFNDHRVRIEIRDEGPGFDVNDVPDPTLEENLEKPGGRGIMLMKAFLTVVEYNETGNCVILEKVKEGHEENGRSH